MAESSSLVGINITRVLVSKHRGYIFIQTDQPLYNPKDKGKEKIQIRNIKFTKINSDYPKINFMLISFVVVRYRIFTLDHTLRPHEETFLISVFVS